VGKGGGEKRRLRLRAGEGQRRSGDDLGRGGLGKGSLEGRGFDKKGQSRFHGLQVTPQGRGDPLEEQKRHLLPFWQLSRREGGG